MIKKSEGIIILIKKIKDNDLFIKILTKNDELISGIVYGGNSSKKKPIYQTGYFIDFNISRKNYNIVSSLNGEISKPFLSSILKDKYKSYSLLSIISLINISVIEGQKLNGLYLSIKNFIDIIVVNNKWITSYCKWLFDFLKIIGYEIDYKSNISNKFFNLISQEFEHTKNSIIFPHQLLNHEGKPNFDEVEAVFNIFESIYSKNHLDNINYRMPSNFTIFKDTILNKLREAK